MAELPQRLRRRSDAFGQPTSLIASLGSGKPFLRDRITG